MCQFFHTDVFFFSYELFYAFSLIISSKYVKGILNYHRNYYVLADMHRFYSHRKYFAVLHLVWKMNKLALFERIDSFVCVFVGMVQPGPGVCVG